MCTKKEKKKRSQLLLQIRSENYDIIYTTDGFVCLQKNVFLIWNLLKKQFYGS